VIGFVNLFKAAGPSSAQAMARVRRIYALRAGDRGLTAGHLGTLDPAACGVLVLLCGKATKLNQKLSGGTKVYRSVFTFGIETDTLDLAGKVITNNEKRITNNDIERVLPEMVGDIEIEVPRFSAVHINGKRAYDLARKGIDFTPPTKTVKIHRFELISQGVILSAVEGSRLCRFARSFDCAQDDTLQDDFWFEIECETGTYIRSLAKLLAQKLGTVAIASTIIRTRVGEFDIKDAKTLQDVTINDLLQI